MAGSTWKIILWSFCKGQTWQLIVPDTRTFFSDSCGSITSSWSHKSRPASPLRELTWWYFKGVALCPSLTGDAQFAPCDFIKGCVLTRWHNWHQLQGPHYWTNGVYILQPLCWRSGSGRALHWQRSSLGVRIKNHITVTWVQFIKSGAMSFCHNNHPHMYSRSM